MKNNQRKLGNDKPYLVVLIILLSMVIIPSSFFFNQNKSTYTAKAEGERCKESLDSAPRVTIESGTDILSGHRIDVKTFKCIVRVNGNMASLADKCNVCAFKINDEWPRPNWQCSVASQDTSHDTYIDTTFNCQLPNDIQAGDTIKVVAARFLPHVSEGVCTGNCNWNDANQYYGVTPFYYQSDAPRATSTPIPQPTVTPGGTDPTPSGCPPKLPVPINLLPVETATVGSIIFQWSLPQGRTAARYALRIDDATDGWAYESTPCNRCTDTTTDSDNHDICCNTVSTNSFTYQTRPNHSYSWWVHSINTTDDVVCTEWSLAAGGRFVTGGTSPTNPTLTPTTTPSPTNTPTPTNTPIPTPNLSCVCRVDGSCSLECNTAYQKYSATELPGVVYGDPIKCTLATSFFQTTPTQTDKDNWCRTINRTKGNANSDTDNNGTIDNLIINLSDYYYYVTAVIGGKIPPKVNPDFNGDGEVGIQDRKIILKSLGQ